MISLTIIVTGATSGILRTQAVARDENATTWVQDLAKQPDAQVRTVRESDFVLSTTVLPEGIRLNEGAEVPAIGEFAFHFRGSGEDFYELKRLVYRLFPVRIPASDASG